jgi:hypothetical protein
MKIIADKLSKTLLLAVWLTFAALLLAQTALAEAPSSNDWTFSGNLYVWTPSIKGETTTGKDIDVSFSDILNNLDFTLMGGMRANKGRLSLLVDVIYMNVEDTSNHTLSRGDLLKLSVTNVDLQAWIVTPMVAWTVIDADRLKLSLLAGARYLYLWAEADFETRVLETTSHSSPSGSTHFWDGIVGAQGTIDLNDTWYLPFLADVGTGDTKLTWQLFGGIGYRFGTLDLVAGYRHLEWDFDSNDKGGELLNDLYISGPMLGIRYFF